MLSAWNTTRSLDRVARDLLTSLAVINSAGTRPSLPAPSLQLLLKRLNGPHDSRCRGFSAQTTPMHRGGCLSYAQVRQVQRSVQDTTRMETAAQRPHLISFSCAITFQGRSNFTLLSAHAPMRYDVIRQREKQERRVSISLIPLAGRERSGIKRAPSSTASFSQ